MTSARLRSTRSSGGASSVCLVDCFKHLRIEQRLERLGQLGLYPVFVEEDLHQECLVEESTNRGRSLPVGRLAVSQQIEGSTEVPFDRLDVHPDGAQLGLDDRQLLGDAILFDLQEVDRDGTGVVRLPQLARSPSSR